MPLLNNKKKVLPQLITFNQCSNNTKYTPQLVTNILQDSDIRQSESQVNRKKSIASESSESLVEESNINDKYDELFRQNISLYKKVDLYKQIIKQAIGSIRIYTQVFVKDLINIENLSHLAQVTVEEYLVKILNVCKDIEQINGNNKQIYAHKNCKNTNANNSSYLSQSKKHYESKNTAGNFKKRVSHIFIDEQIDSDCFQQEIEQKFKGKYEPHKEEIICEISEDEEYSSSNNTVRQDSRSQQQRLIYQQNDLIPISSDGQKNHKKKKEVTSIIDYFCDKLDRKNSDVSSSQVNESRLSNISNKLKKINKLCENRQNQYNLLEPSQVQAETETNRTFQNESQDSQSIIQDQQEGVHSVSAFQSRLPNKSYGDFNSISMQNQSVSHAHAGLSLVSQNNFTNQVKKSILTVKDPKMSRVNTIRSNKQNYPYILDQKNSEQKFMQERGYLESQVLSRRKIFNFDRAYI